MRTHSAEDEPSSDQARTSGEIIRARVATRRNVDEEGREGPGLLEWQRTQYVLRAFHRSYNRLGYGRLEAVYENAMAIELRKMGIPFERQKRIEVWYDEQVIGTYRADLVVDGRVVVEIKAGRVLDESARAQVINYLACSDIQVGLLLHFGPRPKFHRFVYTRNIGREPYPP